MINIQRPIYLMEITWSNLQTPYAQIYKGSSCRGRKLRHLRCMKYVRFSIVPRKNLI